MGNPNARGAKISHQASGIAAFNTIQQRHAATGNSLAPFPPIPHKGSNKAQARQSYIPMGLGQPAISKPVAPQTVDFMMFFDTSRVTLPPRFDGKKMVKTVFTGDKEQEAKAAVLRGIRDKIYSNIYSRDRADRASCDIIVSEHGVKRNVQPPSRNWDSRKTPGPHSDALMYVNKAINRDFLRYVGHESNMEVVMNVKAEDKPSSRDGLAKVVKNLKSLPTILKTNMNQMSVKVHMIPRTEGSTKMSNTKWDNKTIPVCILPRINQDALDDICAEIDTYHFERKKGASLRIVVKFSSEQDRGQMIYTALPFYSLSFTRWELYGQVPGERPHRLAGDIISMCDEAWDRQQVAAGQQTGAIQMMLSTANHGSMTKEARHLQHAKRSLTQKGAYAGSKGNTDISIPPTPTRSIMSKSSNDTSKTTSPARSAVDMTEAIKGRNWADQVANKL